MRLRYARKKTDHWSAAKNVTKPASQLGRMTRKPAEPPTSSGPAWAMARPEMSRNGPKAGEGSSRSQPDGPVRPKRPQGLLFRALEWRPPRWAPGI
ncbi:hypothetical protein BDY21DRAFT_335250 [Lineolata rhizophorae]|uniref:Uncharacterized protein n=1 Tax=Lineolata rhizophorae TaxID=578093 RepID=A0A6A6P8W2_9PEZI|nr:hypothetical protein BDY21DRAFT_335250 [Lineolata rhizophorae]